MPTRTTHSRQRTRGGADARRRRASHRPSSKTTARGRRSGPSRGSDRSGARTLPRGTIRYAVVGLGYIAQAAVLPAFEHARRNSRLAALVSDDEVKLRTLSRRYGVEHVFTYEQFDECLTSGAIDAVYIALPNHLHRDYAVRAAKAGVHVLCEKPMAVTVEHCRDMIEAAEEHRVRLMIAYRLHFDPANLEAIAMAKSGKLGDLKLFNSVFSMQVRAGDIRLQKHTGGGTLYDIGIYCINAARYLFREEPIGVFAFGGNSGEARFREVDESTGALMSFSQGRLATFVTSFGASDRASYELVGTKGMLRVENAYEFSEPATMTVTIGGRTRTKTFPKHDQFAPELLHFSECVLRGRDPEPSGIEGMIDVELIHALYDSADSGKPMPYHGPDRHRRPAPEQEMTAPAVEEMPQLVHAEPPSKD